MALAAVAPSIVTPLPGITETHSHAYVIRNALFDSAKRIPYFATADWTVRRNKMLQVQPNSLPYLGVYFIDETMVPEGDPNAGVIDLQHTMRVGFSVWEAHNDHVVLEGKLDKAFWALMNGLWRDQYLMNFLYTHNPTLGIGTPDNTRMEGLLRGVRRHNFGNQTLDNETPLGELQYDVSIFWRADYAPVITDDFLEMQVRTGIKIGETEEEMAQRQQVEARYTYPQNDGD